MHVKKLVTAGPDLKKARKALIMLHGRGATAAGILSLSTSLHVADHALIAPQATNNSWYPYSFLAPPNQNEPWLSSALSLLKEVVEDINAAGVDTREIYLLGFSQGACLCLEFVTRHAERFGGVVAFTGGLIGDRIYAENYKGDFEGTPFFIGTGNPDMHVPVQRVYASANILRDMHAEVTEKVYDNMGHTISSDEIEKANQVVFTG